MQYLKASDLKIGNLFLYDENAWIEDEYDLKCGTPSYKVGITTLNDLNDSVLEDIKAIPILITTNVLENLGFKTSHNDSLISYRLSVGERTIVLEVTPDGDGRYKYDNLIGIRYVHELQQLLALSDITIEVSPEKVYGKDINFPKLPKFEDVPVMSEEDLDRIKPLGKVFYSEITEKPE